jgi:hypothetical protein
MGAATVKSAVARTEPKGTVTANPGSAPKSLKSGNQLTIAMSATKFSVTLVLLLEPMAERDCRCPDKDKRPAAVCIPTSVRGGAYFFLPGKAALAFLASDRLIAAVPAKTANYPNNAEM